jgi:hypothetical protein
MSTSMPYTPKERVASAPLSKEGTMRRLFSLGIPVVVVLAIPATFGALVVATPAGAAMYTRCGSLSGLNLAGQSDTVAGCTGPTGGSGVFPGPLVSPKTVNWAGGGTTTFTFAVTVPKKSKCAAGSTERLLKGTVTTSTGPASSIKGTVRAKVCVDPNEHLSLLPGTLMKF